MFVEILHRTNDDNINESPSTKYEIFQSILPTINVLRKHVMRNAIQLAVKHDLFGLQTAHDFTANISTSFPGSLGKTLVSAGHVPRPKLIARGGVVKVSNYKQFKNINYYQY